MNTCDSFERFSDTGVFHKPVGDSSTNSARSVINEVAEANAEECQYREPGRNDSFSVRLGRNDGVRSVLNDIVRSMLNDREKGRRRGSGAYPYAPAERPAVRPGITTWLPVPKPSITQLIHHRHFTKSACRQNAARTFGKTLLFCVMIQINEEPGYRMRPSPLR